MTPRDFDRYMIQRGAARHVKFRRLTIPERHAFFLGVLSIAAGARPRGRLLVGAIEATEHDIAHEAGVPVAAARGALKKLQEIGVLQRDDEPGLLVHDWQDWQPAPRQFKPSDAPEATRSRKQRERDRKRGHADVTRVTSRGHALEVEGEVEKTPPAPPVGGRQRDRDRHEEDLGSYASSLLPDADPATALSAVRGALGNVRIHFPDPTRQQVLAEVAKWHPHLVNDEVAA